MSGLNYVFTPYKWKMWKTKAVPQWLALPAVDTSNLISNVYNNTESESVDC